MAIKNTLLTFIQVGTIRKQVNARTHARTQFSFENKIEHVDGQTEITRIQTMETMGVRCLLEALQ